MFTCSAHILSSKALFDSNTDFGFFYVSSSDTHIDGGQLLWTFPNLTIHLQTRITIMLEKEKNQPQRPSIHCEIVTILLHPFSHIFFNVTSPPDIKLCPGIYFTAKTEHLQLLGREPMFYLIWFLWKLQEKDLKENALF